MDRQCAAVAGAGAKDSRNRFLIPGNSAPLHGEGHVWFLDCSPTRNCEHTPVRDAKVSRRSTPRLQRGS